MKTQRSPFQNLAAHGAVLATALAFPLLPAAAQTFSQNVTVTSPDASAPNLKVTGPGGAVFIGNGNGAIPATGDGTRMMWYPGKAAFRVGVVWAGIWEDNNIGMYSMGIGGNSLAPGFAAIALGSTMASGAHSFSAGWGANATGDFSTAMSISTASGFNAFTASGGTASGYQSAAIQGGLALGNHSVAIGSHATAIAPQSTVVGQFNEVIGDPVNQASTDPIFVVGTGTSANDRKNGLAVRRDGQIRMAKRQGDIQMGEFGRPGSGD